MIRSPWTIIAAALILPASLPGQQRMQFSAGGFGGQEIVQSHIDASTSRLSGLMLGLEGALVSDRLVVRIRYAEGRINPKPGQSGGGGLGAMLANAVSASAADSGAR